jgi:hypothetical protein
MKFARTTTSTGMPTTTGKLISQSNRPMNISGWAQATTPKNPNRVQAGRAAAVNKDADEAGKYAASRVMNAAKPKIQAAKTAGVLLAGSKGGTTYNTQNKKTNKK